MLKYTVKASPCFSSIMEYYRIAVKLTQVLFDPLFSIKRIIENTFHYTGTVEKCELRLNQSLVYYVNVFMGHEL